MGESGTDGAKCHKEKSGKEVVVTLKSLVNDSSYQFKCERALHEAFLMFVLLYGSETMKWREKERYRIRGVQMDNLIGLMGIRRIDRMPNAWIIAMWGEKNDVNVL